MGYQLFLEYQIMETKRDDFFKQISNIMQTMMKFGIDSHQFLESIDKNGLIVEMIEVKDFEIARKIKQIRTQKDGILLDLDSHISGGRSKIKCWIFKNLRKGSGEFVHKSD
jgi:hypothetical protein